MLKKITIRLFNKFHKLMKSGRLPRVCKKVGIAK